MSHLCALWIIALAGHVGEPPPIGQEEERAVEVCQMIIESADRQDVDPALAIAVSWNETRLRFGLISPCGARGPMQVLPHYWCPDRRGRWSANGEHIEQGCDLIDAGVFALSYYLEKRGSVGAALRAYGGSQGYASRVLSLAEAIGTLDGE